MVFAWGDNGFGQTSVPAGLSGVVKIAAGYSHSVALRADGTVVCWGDNRYGQCNVPAGLPAVKSITAGYAHTAAVLQDGSVRAWGINTGGESTPPAGLSGVTAIAAGAAHTIALKGDGTYVIWGSGAALSELPPAEFTNIVTIAAGAYRTVAAKFPVDSDHDGLDNFLELQLGTDPFNPSSTNDGYLDGWKYLNGFDPLTPIAALDGTTLVSDALELTLFTLPAGTYQLTTSVDLKTWTNVGTVVTNTRGFSAEDFPITTIPVFYRLVRLQ
jgi:hypothetical protein